MDLEALVRFSGRKPTRTWPSCRTLAPNVRGGRLLRTLAMGCSSQIATTEDRGAKALRDIFKEMKKSLFGTTRRSCGGPPATAWTKRKLMSSATLSSLISGNAENAVIRQYKGVPVEVDPVDFRGLPQELSDPLIPRSSWWICPQHGASMTTRSRQESRPGLERPDSHQFSGRQVVHVGWGLCREVKLGDLPTSLFGPEPYDTRRARALRKLLSREAAPTANHHDHGRPPTAAGINGRLFIHTWGLHPHLGRDYMRRNAVGAAKPSTLSCWR